MEENKSIFLGRLIESYVLERKKKKQQKMQPGSRAIRASAVFEEKAAHQRHAIPCRDEKTNERNEAKRTPLLKAYEQIKQRSASEKEKSEKKRTR